MSPLAITQVSEARVADTEIKYDSGYLDGIDSVGKIGNLNLNEHPSIKELREFYTSGKISAEEHLEGWKRELSYCRILYQDGVYCTPRDDNILGKWLDDVVGISEYSTDELALYNVEKGMLNAAIADALNGLSRLLDKKERFINTISRFGTPCKTDL